jgi:hypothetical protein
MDMRRHLGILLTIAAVVATAACGSSSSTTGGAGGPDTPKPGTVVPGAHTVLVSQTAAGGRVAAQATALDTPAQVAAFVGQFHMPAMRLLVERALSRLKHDRRPLVGAVVAIGCDRPPGVDVVYGADTTIRLLPHEVASPLPECLVPVTTVALASVPGSD